MVISDGLDFYLKVPSTKNEANAVQLELYQKFQRTSGSLDDFAVAFLLASCNVSQSALLFVTFPTDSIADVALTTATNFLNSDSPRTKAVYPVLQLNGVDHYCVKDIFNDMTFGQFVAAEEQLFLYFLRKKNIHLVKLSAALYTPKGEQFYDSLINKNWKKIKNKLSLDQLHLNLQFYLGSRSVIINRFKHTFPKSKEKEPAEKNFTAGNILKMVQSYHGKMVQFAKTPDRKKEMYHENVWTVLEFIEADIIQYKEFKKNNP